VGVFVIWFILVSLYLTDATFYNSQYTYQLILTKDCKYVMPPGMNLKYVESKKKWAVSLGNDKYLWIGNYGIRTMHSSLAMPIMFNDSCYAKALCKMYIEDQQPKIK